MAEHSARNAVAKEIKASWGQQSQTLTFDTWNHIDSGPCGAKIVDGKVITISRSVGKVPNNVSSSLHTFWTCSRRPCLVQWSPGAVCLVWTERNLWRKPHIQTLASLKKVFSDCLQVSSGADLNQREPHLNQSPQSYYLRIEIVSERMQQNRFN